ncbi:MMPL family transporter, partial [bacterium]|nr:MMPL family transporter [bacterium]
MKSLFDNYISFSWRHLWIPLIFLLIAASGGVWYLSENFKLNGDFRALFEGETKTVKSLEMLESRVGSASTISILVSSPDRDKNIAFMKKIASDVQSLEKVRFVEYDRDIEYLESRGLLYLSLDELSDIQKRVQGEIAAAVSKSLSLEDSEEEKDNDKDENVTLSNELDSLIVALNKEKGRHHIRKYFEAENGTLMVMKVRPDVRDTAVSATKQIVEELEGVVAKHNPKEFGVTVEVGGFFRNKVREIDQINKDLYSTLLLCVLLLIIVIVFYFRSLSALAVILLPLSFGILSGIALTLAFLGEFNIVSASSFAILYGLGIDFGIHLFARYTENRVLKQEPLQAMKATYRQTVPAIVSGAITTALAFFSIVFIDFKGFSDFGFIAGVGVITSLIAILFFFPVLIFLFEKSIGVRSKALPVAFLSIIFNKLKRHSGKVIVVASLLIVVSIAGITLIPFEYRLNRLSFPKIYQEDSLTRRYSRAVKKDKTDLISTSIPTFILTDSAEETLEVTRA